MAEAITIDEILNLGSAALGNHVNKKYRRNHVKGCCVITLDTGNV